MKGSEVSLDEQGSQSRKTHIRSLLAELKACGNSRNLRLGKEIHEQAIQTGSQSHIYVATALVIMYAKCGRMAEARQVFDRIKYPDQVSWNALILGYAENGEGALALDLFATMKLRGFVPNSKTFVAALKACSDIALVPDGSKKAGCLELGKRIHSEVGCHLNIYVQSALIEMYGRCGSMVDAYQVFDNMKQRDAVSWTALILGYVENGECITALNLYARLTSQGSAPDPFTAVAALKACSSLAALEQDGSCLERGKQIHLQIGWQSDVYVQSALIDMYAKCGSMVDARKVFDRIQHPDVVSWTALLSGYADNGEGLTALHLLSRMRSQGCAPNSFTFVAALKACVSLASEQDESGRAECRKWGEQIHSEIGCHSNPYIENVLIDVYAKCGSMVDARKVFDGMKHPDVVSWNTLILGYADNGESATSLDLFPRMRSQGCLPNCITFIVTLKACGLLGALEPGKKIHADMDSGEAECNAIAVTTLVDFYARCGDLVEARKVFDSHPHLRDLTTWNALLAGYSHLGDRNQMLELFEGMKDAGFSPNAVTFSCILTCCTHAGLLEEAIQHFEALFTRYGVVPTVEHYTCMVDILGRSKKLDDAMALCRSMPCRSNVITWMTVIGACRRWSDFGTGRLAFESLVSLDHSNAAAYVLMAHICKSKGMWEEQSMVLGMRQKFKAREVLERSCWTSEIEVHMFHRSSTDQA